MDRQEQDLRNLISYCTSFKTLEELMASVAGGYIPSLGGKNKAEGRLANHLRRIGVRVYRNGTVA
jgi:hypothetical protein